MTYQEFKNKYDGKYVDYDGHYGNQCWDLGQKYLVECLNLPPSVLSGCGLVSNMLYQPKRADLDKYFDEVPDTDMHTGDVCIWEYGHIAIFDHWDGKNCWYFSQNPNPPKVMKITTGGIHAFRLKSTKEEPKKECKYKLGDIVTINGVYKSSTSATKLKSLVKVGMITKIVEGAKNPYLLNAGQIGWVNDDCIVEDTFHLNDVVVPTKLVDINGTHLVQYDKEYYIKDLKSNKATLCAKRDGRFYVWATLPLENIKKVR